MSALDEVPDEKISIFSMKLPNKIVEKY